MPYNHAYIGTKDCSLVVPLMVLWCGVIGYEAYHK